MLISTWNGKSDFAWDRILNSERYNDHGINFIGGAGDPVGLFDVAGQILSTWGPENRYLAMAVGIIGAVALRKPWLITAEERLIVGNGGNYVTSIKERITKTVIFFIFIEKACL